MRKAFPTSAGGPGGPLSLAQPGLRLTPAVFGRTTKLSELARKTSQAPLNWLDYIVFIMASSSETLMPGPIELDTARLRI